MPTSANRSPSCASLPKISVVVPSFNQCKFIERCLVSILDQGYPDLELIIIDGGSEDGTIDVLRKYDGAIAYWQSTSDQGQSDALNQGFARATGDVFGWMNADDMYVPGAFHRVAPLFAGSPNTNVVFGDWLEIDSDDNVIQRCYAFDFSIAHLIYEGFHINAQAMFWRREAHERFGKFDTELHRTMDYDLILRIGLREGSRTFKRIPDALASFRRHPEQKTRGFDNLVRDEHLRIAHRAGVMRKYSKLGRLLRVTYRVRRAAWYLRRGGLGYFGSKVLHKRSPEFSR